MALGPYPCPHQKRPIISNQQRSSRLEKPFPTSSTSNQPNTAFLFVGRRMPLLQRCPPCPVCEPVSLRAWFLSSLEWINSHPMLSSRTGSCVYLLLLNFIFPFLVLVFFFLPPFFSPNSLCLVSWIGAQNVVGRLLLALRRTYVSWLAQQKERNTDKEKRLTVKSSGAATSN